MNYGILITETQKEAIWIMAAKNQEDYSKSRGRILLRLAGMRESPKAILDNIFDGNTDKKEIIADLFSGKKTPYEIVGLLKEQTKKMSKKEMTDIWTKLSLATVIANTHGVGPILPKDFDLDQELAEKCVLPKAKTFDESVKNPKNIRYYEARPHLKDSTLAAPNWAEILGNLPPGVRKAAELILKGDQKSPGFELAAKALLWPASSEVEKENTRINKFLNWVPSRGGSRAKTAAKCLAAAYEPPKTINKQTIPYTQEDRTFKDRIEKDIENILTLGGEGKYASLEELYKKTKKLHPKDQESVREEILKEFRSENSAKSHPKLVVPEIYYHAGVIPRENQISFRENRTEAALQATLEAAISRGEETIAIKCLQLGIRPKDPANAQIVKGWLEKELEPGDKTGPFFDILVAALSEDIADTTKKYGGKGYTVLHACAWYRSAECVEETFTAAKSRKEELFPKDSEGVTPAFYISRYDVARVLLKHNPDLKTCADDGSLPTNTSQMAGAAAEHAKKIGIRKALAAGLENQEI